MLARRDRVTRSGELGSLGGSPVKDTRRAMRHPSWRGLRPDRTPAAARQQPAPTVPAPVTVEGALATPDRRWRVEVIQRNGLRSYRLLYADNVIDGLDLTAVEDLLGRAGINLGDLVEIKDTESTHRSGAAWDAVRHTCSAGHVACRRAVTCGSCPAILQEVTGLSRALGGRLLDGSPSNARGVRSGGRLDVVRPGVGPSRRRRSHP
jgi:hypothetical protein